MLAHYKPRKFPVLKLPKALVLGLSSLIILT